MIDFRYHLVSIIAIFLALSTGIVVGATALNGGVVHDLNGRVRGLLDDKDKLRGQVSDLQAQSANDDAFITAAAPALVGGRLNARRVVVVSLPGAGRELRDKLVQEIEDAGATVTAQVRLLPKLVDPESATLLDDLTVRIVPPGLHLPAGEASDRAMTVLAAALVDRSVGSATAPTSGPGSLATFTRVTAAFREAGLIALDQPSKGPGTLAVLVAGPPASASGGAGAVSADGIATQLAALAVDLDVRGLGAVIVGPQSSLAAGGQLGLLRHHPEVVSRVSTVDDADHVAGLLATVLALAEQAGGGAGQYGVGAGASAPIPDVASG